MGDFRRRQWLFFAKFRRLSKWRLAQALAAPPRPSRPKEQALPAAPSAQREFPEAGSASEEAPGPAPLRTAKPTARALVTRFSKSVESGPTRRPSALADETYLSNLDCFARPP